MATTTEANVAIESTTPSTEVQKPLHLLENYTKNDNDDDDNNKPYTIPSYDRNWLTELIKKHSSDPRLQTYYKELHAKYPILINKALVVAPMVDQSDLPFRMLCRDYGANLCFTPMVHANMFTEMKGYRKKFWSYVNGTPESDRPLIVQLCGSNKENLLYTIKYIIESKNGVDGIDLNCGCPQTIAKRGMYGAYLLEKDNGDKIVDVVQFLVKEVGHLIPISVKVRILPSGVDDSLVLYGRLIDAGAAMLTIHGRTRLQKMYKTGRADWDAIKKVVDLYGHRIPIIANGSIATLDDVRECLVKTGVDGVMSSESILEYPPIFTETGTKAVNFKRTGPSRLQMAKEYLYYTTLYPSDKAGQGSGNKCTRAHFHRFLHADLGTYHDVRAAVAWSHDYQTFQKACEDIGALHKADGHVVRDEALCWYMRHRVQMEEEKERLEKRRLGLVKEEKKVVDPDEEGGMDCTNLFGGGGCDDDDDDGEQCW
jgi:tRNA-dihydrouridine synthase 1